MSNDKTKNNNSITNGVIGMAFIVALVFAVVYVFGNDRAGEVALASATIGGAVSFAHVIVAAFKFIDSK